MVVAVEDRARRVWKRPPLAYVVAELAISPYYSLKDMIPGLQNALREAFPRTVEGAEFVMDTANPVVTQPIWQLISADAGRGVCLSSRRISIHSTVYSDFAEFQQGWSQVLGAVEAQNMKPFVERAGLRYLDLVVPGADRAVRDYIVESSRGISTIEGANLHSNFSAATLEIDGFILQANMAVPSPQGMFLPPNFNLLQLQKPLVMQQAEEASKQRQIGYVDTDCWRPVQSVFNAPQLLDLFGQLHDRVKGLFISLLSDVAIREWK